MGRMIGVFGGTFDPPHLGHLILAERAREDLDLETVLWVLTPRSPLKPDGDRTPVEIRARLVQAAIADNARFRLSTVDIDHSPPHYAADTLERLRASMAQVDLVYLMGADTLADLLRWHDPQRFVSLCSAIGVMDRAGSPRVPQELEQTIPGIAAKLRPFPAPRVEVSARDIRQRVARGTSIRYLVPEPVRQIILTEGLYRSSV